MNRWFFGCSHFSHANIIKYCNRPFRNLAEMDLTMLTNINSLVAPEDELYILGDFCLGGKPNFYTKRINCKNTHLILGNHDRLSQCNGHFKTIQDKLDIEIDGQKVFLHHHPYLDSIDPNYDNKFKDRMLSRQGNRWLIHSHIHNGPNSWKVKNRQIHVGMDWWEYKPVSEAQIIEIMKNN